MKRRTRLLFRRILLGVLIVSLAVPQIAWGQRVTITPGKDSQVFRPETPGYRIKKEQEKVEELMKVPPPPSEPEKKKDEKPREKK